MFGLKLSLCLAFTWCIAISPALAQKLRVGVAGSPPFIFQKEGARPTGLSVDVWNKVAQTQNIEYEFVPVATVREAIELVNQKQVDLVIGPIGVTSARLEKVAFTQPYFVSEIGLLAPKKRSLLNQIAPVIGWTLLSFSGILAGGLFIMGNLIWLVEKEHNTQHFPKSYARGVANGMWFAMVTLTTVGYGDHYPITIRGRMITFFWMLLTMLTTSSLIAGLTSTLTLVLSDVNTQTFKNPQDLHNRMIAVVSGSTGEAWADFYGAKMLKLNRLNEAINALNSNQVEGVVFDTPALQYYLHENPQMRDKLKIEDFSLAKETYAFILPLNSPLLPRMNVAILKWQEQIDIRKALEDKWLVK